MAASHRVGFVLAMLVGVVGLAQGQKPNFSGTWLLVAPAERAAQAPGQEQLITQTDTTITLGHPSEGAGHQTTYRLDGQETENLIASIRLLSRASWDGHKLVLVDKDATSAAPRRAQVTGKRRRSSTSTRTGVSSWR